MSVVASNNSDATLKIGTSSDDDEFLAATAIGDSGHARGIRARRLRRRAVPARLEDGDLVVITLDFDGAAGTAAQNVTLVLTFAEG